MVMRVERRGEEYCVVIPQQALEELWLSEGAAVEMLPVAEPVKPVIRYITVEEALESFYRTESFHANTYRELAK